MDNLKHHDQLKGALTASDEGEIAGYAWLWNEPDRVGDIIVKGAAKLANAELPILFAHDPEQPIGLWDEIKEDDKGLYVRGKLFIQESQRARATYSMIKTGLISGLSIRFSTLASHQRGKNRVITGLVIKEVSAVKDPSHDSARISTAKNVSAAIADVLHRAAVALRT